MSLNALNRIHSPFNPFAPVKLFIHVDVRTDDKVYNCKTAAITFIYLSIVSMISKLLNVSIAYTSRVDLNQRISPLRKVYGNMYERLDWRKSVKR
jgi:hypothetical protein